MPFFGSPWIPELLFVVGKLNEAVLDTHSREREEAYRSNRALYQISHYEKRWNSDRFRQREQAAAEVRGMANEVKRVWKFENVGVGAEGMARETNRTPRLTNHGNRLLATYHVAKTHLDELSSGRQIPHVAHMKPWAFPSGWPCS